MLAAPAAALLPNEPLFGQQYALNNTGQLIGGNPGKPDADIHAAEAWDVTTGSSAVTVAMVDDGVDPGSPTSSRTSTRPRPRQVRVHQRDLVRGTAGQRRRRALPVEVPERDGGRRRTRSSGASMSSPTSSARR